MARSVESRRTINQTEQTVREPGDDEVLRYVLSDVTTTPSARIQISQVGARFIDQETNTSEVEIRPPREEVRTDIIHAHSKGIQVPFSSSEFSSHNMNIEESMVRPHIPNITPQLDGPASVCVQRKQPVPVVRNKTTIPGEGYPDESDSDSHDNSLREDRRYPGRRRYYQERGGRPLDIEDNQGRGYPGRGRPRNDGGPPDCGGPPDDGGPPGNGRLPGRPRRQGPPGPPGPPGPVCPIIVQQPQVTLDTSMLENTFGTVGQSMLQLATAQDQTNRYLQEHLQQGQMNM